MPPTLEPTPKETEILPRYTTPEQLESYQDMMDPERRWVRKASGDKTLHRVAHMIPQFTGATGEDFVGHPKFPGDETKSAQHCFWRCSVERFEEKATDKKGGKARNALGSFLMDADKFMAEFVKV